MGKYFEKRMKELMTLSEEIDKEIHSHENKTEFNKLREEYLAFEFTNLCLIRSRYGNDYFCPLLPFDIVIDRVMNDYDIDRTPDACKMKIDLLQQINKMKNHNDDELCYIIGPHPKQNLKLDYLNPIKYLATLKYDYVLCFKKKSKSNYTLVGETWHDYASGMSKNETTSDVYIRNVLKDGLD